VTTGRFELELSGPFSLAQSIAFAGAFVPVRAPQADDEVMRLAFVDDGGEGATVAVRQDGDRVIVDYRSSLAAARVAAHTARILSLDVDATGFAAVGERDADVGALQREFPGRRPVCFGSPFEAAVWALLSQRTSMRQAAGVRRRLVEALGEPLELDGVTLHAFPAPQRLAALEEFPGVPAVKAERLRGLAHAALAGELDPGLLRSRDPEQTLEALQRLAGVGPFSSELILLRGAGHPDVLPRHAPWISPDLAARAEAWRPFRSWVAFLLRNRSEAS
jgi:DNA-3-methyladenine glycosylase II